MKKSILITGHAGSGKTTMCSALLKRGYEAYDIEKIKDMCHKYKKGTKENFKDFDMSNLDDIKNHDWVCDIEKLKDLIEHQKKGIAFYCGVLSNINEVASLFDKIILLKVTDSVMRSRLESRVTGFGHNEEVREFAIRDRKKLERMMINREADVIDADNNVDDLVKDIEAKIQS